VIAGTVPYALDRRAERRRRAVRRRDRAHARRGRAERAHLDPAPDLGDLLIAAGLHAGPDVLVLPVIAALGGGVTSAWLLLTRIDA
jgi:hypothetical protein